MFAMPLTALHAAWSLPLAPGAESHVAEAAKVSAQVGSASHVQPVGQSLC